MLNNLDQIIEKKSYPPILLLFGEEEFLLESAYEKLISSMFPNRANEFDFEVFDGESANLESVVDSCLSYPFISEKRVVVVKNFELLAPGKTLKKNDEYKSFAKYLDSPQPTTVLIIKTKNSKLNGFAAAKKSNKTTNINKILKAAKFPYDRLLEEYEWIEYPKMYENSFPAWITQKAKESGKSISSEAVEFLIAQTNLDLRSINNELEKAVIYVQQKKHIDLNDLTFVMGASHKYNVFELQKSIGKKDLTTSLNIIERMLTHEQQEMLILTIITRYFVILWKLLEIAGKNMNNYEIAQKIGVSPYFVPEYLDALGLYKPAEIDNALIQLTKTDEILKSSSQESIYTIQQMVIEIINK